MKPLLRHLALLPLLLWGVRSGAETAERSPFLPQSGPTVAAPTKDAPLELRGIMVTGDVTMFSIYNPATRKSTWLKQEEKGLDFTVKSHQPDKDVVTVDFSGRLLTLELQKSKVVAQAVPAAPVATSNTPTAMPEPVINPTTVDEQRRMEAVATEIRRRRALREQASQQQPPAEK